MNIIFHSLSCMCSIHLTTGFSLFSYFFFFIDTAITEIYTFPYTTLFRSRRADRLRARRGPARTRAHRATDRMGVSGRCRSEEHTSELQSHSDLVCRLLLEKKKKAGVHGARDVIMVESAKRQRAWQNGRTL